MGLRKQCYYCGQVATSTQHLPPKLFFPKDNRDIQLITVPSCDAHNHAFKDLEREFNAYLVGGHGVSESGQKVLQKHVLSESAQREPHMRNVRKNLHLLKIHNQEVGIITVKPDMAEAFLTMLTRGLVFKLYPDDWNPELYFGVRHLNSPKHSPEQLHTIGEQLAGILPYFTMFLKSDVFTCFHRREKDTVEFLSAWLFQFYQVHEFLVFCSSKPKTEWE